MQKKRALAYIRVSTLEQANGLGLDVQAQAIRAWCKSNGYRLVRTIRDAGQSGAKGEEVRPGLAEALVKLEADKPEADVLVVARLDRLARDLVLQETVIARLGRVGRQVISVAEPDLNGDPTRDLVRQILGAIAQYERGLIAARMAAGRAMKKAKGEYAGGRPGYGWQAEGGALVPTADEQKAIRLARRLHGSGMSLRRIAGRLDGRGFKPKKGKAWHPQQVARLVEGRSN